MLSTPEDTTRQLTDEEIYVRSAKHEYDTVARKLEDVARRMREIGQRLDHADDRTTAVGVAAEAISEYTQCVGNIGTFLWGVIHAAEHLDRHRREQSEGGDQHG